MYTFSRRATSRLRAVFAVAMMTLGLAVIGTSASTVATASAATNPHTYDLVSSNGTVYNFGGAGFYGDEKGHHLAGAIVSMSITSNGRGYWLAGTNGSVFNFGDAKWYGSLASRHLTGSKAIVAIHSMSNNKGYWLVARNGTITHFGDATAINRLAGQHEAYSGSIVGAAMTPSGHGAWLVNADGDVYTVGAATSYGSLAGRRLSSRVTAIAATPDGKGYWLTDKKGAVYAFGDATTKQLDSSPDSTVVGIAHGASQRGYWAVTGTGTVIPGGGETVTSTAKTVLGSSNDITDIAPAIPPVPRYTSPASGSVGFDVNWPQCTPQGSSAAKSLPSLSSRSMAVVGVDGWAMDSYNSCLSAEASWAAHASSSYELYMFLNSPQSATSGDQTGPDGTCADKSGTARSKCLAYNYGYNSATDAVAYASSVGAHSHRWWIDVENGSCGSSEWSDLGAGDWWSCNHTLNSQTIAGAVAGLKAKNVAPGIYCTSVQWAEITGNYKLADDLPLWIAGAYWTSPPYPSSYHYPSPSENASFCAGDHDFAGGHAALLQETPGDNGYPYDPDYAC